MNIGWCNGKAAYCSIWNTAPYNEHSRKIVDKVDNKTKETYQLAEACTEEEWRMESTSRCYNSPINT